MHNDRWMNWRPKQLQQHGEADFTQWLATQEPFPDWGICRVAPCPDAADHPLGLCTPHRSLYRRQGRPGGATAPRKYGRYLAADPPLIPITYDDELAFRQWCRQTDPLVRMDGRLTLLGLRPLVKAEIKWAMVHHSRDVVEGGYWPISILQHLATACRHQGVDSLADLELGSDSRNRLRQITGQMLRQLRLVYFSRQDTKDAGFLETDHYGIRLRNYGSYIDLSGVSQRWLRDMLWDWMDHRLTADPPRSHTPLAVSRRGCVELSAYLEATAPAGGHDPTVLTADHALGFVADQRHRAKHGLPSLGGHTSTRVGPPKPSPVTACTLAETFNGARRVLRAALDRGANDRAGLDRAFVVTLPHGRGRSGRRRPFPDVMARALANEDNLQEFARADTDDRGLRDIWEALVFTGRRCGEVLGARLDCISRINKIPFFWHDQTKVGNLDEGIRIPERLFQVIERRQVATIARFVERHGRPPTSHERTEIALFPRRTANRHMLKGVSYTWFHQAFRAWVDALDLGHGVPHQARHSLATNLLKAGANLTHVKRYLGQVSEKMAEHYTHLAQTDPRLTDALNAIWVTGPGAPEPGIALTSGEPMTREEAEAMLIDLTRKSTPAEGGFCTFQPVVEGNACPWKLDCHNCDKFVMTGADLVYWHRKREQWRTVAEGAPDDKTADYLHDLFEPTARAIEGLEKALEAVGLLEEALALDLRRPQDYFGRVWSTAFRADELRRHQEDSEAA
ncbi:site-specific integrase [Streptomyces sp. NBC_01278]|uniref:tyrosine-type recombinase/integrase n=1 Tax=Streptomyces sp. NBC_01278 TaxID=2903809 RepID=UPI002E2FF462|nr:site-specific integrase [Streptomyces sp. NBC_01278]